MNNYERHQQFMAKLRAIEANMKEGKTHSFDEAIVITKNLMDFLNLVFLALHYSYRIDDVVEKFCAFPRENKESLASWIFHMEKIQLTLWENGLYDHIRRLNRLAMEGTAIYGTTHSLHRLAETYYNLAPWSAHAPDYSLDRSVLADTTPGAWYRERWLARIEAPRFKSEQEFSKWKEEIEMQFPKTS